MKQTSTLESELAMIIDLLSDMVESGNIKIEEVDHIIEAFFDKQNQKSNEMLPGKNVIKNIMNYSKSLDVMKHPGTEPMITIIN